MSHASQPAQTAVSNHRLGGFHSSHLFLAGLGDEKPRVKVPAGFSLGKALFLSWWQRASWWHSAWKGGWAAHSLASSDKDTNAITRLAHDFISAYPPRVSFPDTITFRIRVLVSDFGGAAGIRPVALGLHLKGSVLFSLVSSAWDTCSWERWRNYDSFQCV